MDVEGVLEGAADFLGERRAFSRRGNRDLQVSSANHGREIEIAIGRIIYGIAENAAPLRIAKTA